MSVVSSSNWEGGGGRGSGKVIGEVCKGRMDGWQEADGKGGGGEERGGRRDIKRGKEWRRGRGVAEGETKGAGKDEVCGEGDGEREAIGGEVRWRGQKRKHYITSMLDSEGSFAWLWSPAVSGSDFRFQINSLLHLGGKNIWDYLFFFFVGMS